MTAPVRDQPVILSEPDDSAWDDFVARHDGSSIYHLSAFRHIIAGQFRHEPHYLSARDNENNITGILPLIRLKSRLFGDYIVSMPYFNYGGVLGNSSDTEQHLMKAAADKAAELGCSHIEFRHTQSLPGDWPARTDKVVMKLGLPDSADMLWKHVGPKLRAQVRRPQKEGATARSGGVELLDAFYRVFSINMRDLGTPVYPKSFFAKLLRAFPAQAHILVVELQGRPVAAAFLLGFRDTLEIPWASSLRAMNKYSVNMLLYWEALEFAIEKGYRRFDFGRSSTDSGTYRFKKQWGAEPEQLYWHYWLSDGSEIPLLTPNNPKYRLAIRAWQNMPVFLANWLGPRIIKNLP